MTGYTRFAELGTATVSDALDRLGLPGSAHGIAPIADGLRMAGPAYTVRYVPVGDPKGTVGDYKVVLSGATIAEARREHGYHTLQRKTDAR
jgi:regulator of RNase E activity RraA